MNYFLISCFFVLVSILVFRRDFIFAIFLVIFYRLCLQIRFYMLLFFFALRTGNWDFSSKILFFFKFFYQKPKVIKIIVYKYLNLRFHFQKTFFLLLFRLTAKKQQFKLVNTKSFEIDITSIESELLRANSFFCIWNWVRVRLCSVELTCEFKLVNSDSEIFLIF